MNRLVARASGPFESKRTDETPVPLQPRRFRGSKRKSCVGRNLTLALLVLGTWTQVVAQDARFFRIVGPVPTTITEVTAEGVVTWTNEATNATFTIQTVTALPGETNWVDWVQVPVTNAVTVHRVFDPNPPAGMVLIPAGSFTMGDTLGDWLSGWTPYPEVPAHAVYVSAFYMDRYEVTKSLWDEVKAWALANGYSFVYADSGQGKAANHPAHWITWYDAVKWCNARSEKEGRVPAYYTSAALTGVYRSGLLNVQNDWVNWNSGGYRLPTEAEWEKAARGGASGLRFPWGNTITHSLANYYSTSSSTYDVSTTRGYHPTFNTGGTPYTSPVGYFGANGYGLHDMAGNVWEWCWDWRDSYSHGSQTDPRGPTLGSYRVNRGGGWDYDANYCRAAYRYSIQPTGRHHYLGFRSVLPSGK